MENTWYESAGFRADGFRAVQDTHLKRCCISARVVQDGIETLRRHLSLYTAGELRRRLEIRDGDMGGDGPVIVTMDLIQRLSALSVALGPLTADMEKQVLPTAIELLESDDPGMHRTKSVLLRDITDRLGASDSQINCNAIVRCLVGAGWQKLQQTRDGVRQWRYAPVAADAVERRVVDRRRRAAVAVAPAVPVADAAAIGEYCRGRDEVQVRAVLAAIGNSDPDADTYVLTGTALTKIGFRPDQTRMGVWIRAAVSHAEPSHE